MLQNVRRSLALLCIAVESTRLPCSALGFVVTSLAPPPSKSKARCVALFCQQNMLKLQGCIAPQSSLGDGTYLRYARRSSAASQVMHGHLGLQSLRVSHPSGPSSLKCFFPFASLSPASALLLLLACHSQSVVRRYLPPSI